MDDRIKLAEAMGWEIEKPYESAVRCRYGGKATMRLILPNGGGQICNDETIGTHLPDPFTSANDDYAVLEWMRETIVDQMRPEDPVMVNKVLASHSQSLLKNRLGYKFDYQIGDYARAALKVLGETK